MTYAISKDFAVPLGIFGLANGHLRLSQATSRPVGSITEHSHKNYHFRNDTIVSSLHSQLLPCLLGSR